jgi:DegV family protein with EDD domain
MPVTIITDSSSLMPPELARRYGITVVPVTVVINGVEYVDGIDIDADSFYAFFADGATPVLSTSQPSPGRFAAAYQEAVANGASEILSIHVSSAVSGTLNSASLAAADSPVPVQLVDTGLAGFGISCCVWEAAEALRAGASLENAATVAEATAATVGNVFIVHALELMRSGGRVAIPENAATAGIPILSYIGTELKVVGTAGDVEAAAQAMAAFCTRPELGSPLRAAIGTADRATAPLSQALDRLLASHPAVSDVVHYRIGPSMGANTGPGTSGAFFYPARI